MSAPAVPSKASSQGRFSASRVMADPLLRSSAFMFAAQVATAVLGFAFWALAARLYDTEQVGIASALLSAISLLSYLSLLGLNNLIFLKSQELHRTKLFATAFAIVGLLGFAGGAAYVVAVQFVSPRLGEAVTHPLMIVSFAVAAWGAAANVLTDSVFVAKSVAHYNLWLNALLQGAVRLVCLVVVVGLGATGLVLSSGLAVALTAVASLVVIGSVLHIPLWSAPRRHVVSGQVPFVAATYVSSVLYLIPLIATPLLIVARRGAESNAYFFVAFQIAFLLYAASDAIGQSLFAQAVLVTARRALLRRSALVLIAVTVGGIVASEALAGPALRVFGGQYAEQSLGPLRILLLAAVAVGLNVWTSFVLRLYQRVGWLVVANVAYVVVTLGLTAVWVTKSLELVALAWLLGNLAAAAVACVALAPLTLRGRPAVRDGRVPVAATPTRGGMKA